MNETLRPPRRSWLTLVGSAESVLGPSRGHTPNLSEYRIENAFLSSRSLWLFGSVTGLPREAESNGIRGELSKFHIALDISIHKLLSLSGTPELDSELDDSMHGFSLARPVALSISVTEELVWPDGDHRILRLVAKSAHFTFDLTAQSVTAYGGKHARKRFSQMLPREV
jgi:hypothetical protein